MDTLVVYPHTACLARKKLSVKCLHYGIAESAGPLKKPCDPCMYFLGRRAVLQLIGRQGESGMTRSFDELHSGVVLAELGGHGDGPYCAIHAAGGALAVMGTYIVDPGDDVPYPEHFVFKPGRGNYAEYLREHVAAARQGVAKVGVSVVSVAMADTLDFLRAAEAAGADYASYCAHSSMAMFVNEGLSSMLCRRDRWAELGEWARAIVEAVSIPVIFKIGATDVEETVAAVAVMTEAGVPVIHINIWDTQPGAEGLAVLSALKGTCSLLIAGGGVKDVQGARRVLDAGADAVAIGTAAMKDPQLIGGIQEMLRA